MRLFTQSFMGGDDVDPTDLRKSLLLYVGQSNLNKRNLKADIPEYLLGDIPNCYIFHQGVFYPLNSDFQSNAPAGDFASIIQTAYDLNKANPTKEDYFAFWCVGGTKINYWSAPSGIGWNGALDNYTALIDGKPEDWRTDGLVYFQGESDGLLDADSLAYKGKEIQLVTDYNTFFRVEDSTKLIWINLGNIENMGVPYIDNVRQAKIDNFAEGLFDSLVETFDLEVNPLDIQHFAIPQQIEIGKRVAISYLN